MRAGEYERLLEPLLAQAAAYARALLHDAHDAEDAVQEAALRGWERIATFDTRRPFKGWWFAVLRNCCMDVLRRSKARPVEFSGHFDPAAATREDLPDWSRLAAAIAAISEMHREVLRLRYFAELSYAEIAEALAIPKGTVMSRLHLARRALAAQMRKDEP